MRVQELVKYEKHNEKRDKYSNVSVVDSHYSHLLQAGR